MLLPFLLQGKVIYHQTMTPPWLEAHASYIDSYRSETIAQITFKAGSIYKAALIKVSMIPAGVVKDSTPLTVEITVAQDVKIGQKEDSDIGYGVSDGTRFIAVETNNKKVSINGFPTSPCYGMEGLSGSRITSRRYGSYTAKPSDPFYPGQVCHHSKVG